MTDPKIANENGETPRPPGEVRYGDRPRWKDLIHEARNEDKTLTDETFTELATSPLFTAGFEAMTPRVIALSARALQNYRARASQSASGPRPPNEALALLTARLDAGSPGLTQEKARETLRDLAYQAHLAGDEALSQWLLDIERSFSKATVGPHAHEAFKGWALGLRRTAERLAGSPAIVAALAARLLAPWADL